MGLSASQGRLLLLTARRSDLEYRAQQISQKRLILSQQLEEISLEYEEATTNRQMKIQLYLGGELKDDNDSANPSRQTNLTYAALISGCFSKGVDRTGIQPYGRTESYLEDGAYSSMAAYRLVNADGAIVVSSFEEIPSLMTPPPSEEAAKLDTEHSGTVGIYESDDGKGKITNSLLAGGGNAEGMIFREIFGEDPADGAMKNVEFDKENGVIKYTPDDGDVKYFSIATGKLYDKGLQNDELQGKSFTWEKASIYADEASLPISKKPQDAQPVGLTDNIVADGYCVVKGHDGVYSLYEDGSLVNRYVVDETLAYGSTDVYGSQDGPNYLQDCIRNGKYLIQQYKDDENKDEGYRWSQVPWDALATIHDGYYTEDDDAAKAKYDRLQNEIQAQDKKLELELDQIETQRQAVTTEIESVNKVISENVEKTFNAFG